MFFPMNVKTNYCYNRHCALNIVKIIILVHASCRLVFCLWIDNETLWLNLIWQVVRKPREPKIVDVLEFILVAFRKFSYYWQYIVTNPPPPRRSASRGSKEMTRSLPKEKLTIKSIIFGLAIDSKVSSCRHCNFLATFNSTNKTTFKSQFT